MQHIDDIRPSSDAADRVRLKRYLVATALVVGIVLVVPPEASSLVFLPYCYVTGFVVFRRVQRLPEPARGATLPLVTGRRVTVDVLFSADEPSRVCGGCDGIAQFPILQEFRPPARVWLYLRWTDDR